MTGGFQDWSVCISILLYGVALFCRTCNYAALCAFNVCVCV